MTDTAQASEPSGAQKMFGDFAPGLVHFTDDVLFGQVWKRPQLSPKESSLITVAALTAAGGAGGARTHDRRIMRSYWPGAPYALPARIPRSRAAGGPDCTACTDGSVHEPVHG